MCLHQRTNHKYSSQAEINAASHLSYNDPELIKEIEFSNNFGLSQSNYIHKITGMISKQTVMLTLALFFHTEGNQAVNLSVRSLDLIGVMREGGEGQTGPKRSRLIQNFAAENPKQ